MTPHLEVTFVRDEFDRASLENALTARIDGTSLPIGLYTIFGKTLSDQRLEEWARRLDVEDEYERLKRA